MQTFTLNALLEDDEPFHSDLQIDAFILRRNGAFHPYGTYKQALKELKARFHTLLEVLQGTRAMLEHSEPDLSTAQQVQRALQHKNHADLFREFARFYAVCCELKQQLCPDGPLTAERRAQLEEELWAFKLKMAVVLDCRYHGLVARATLEQVLCLPRTVRHELLAFVDARAAQVEFWDRLVNSEDLALPATRSPEFLAQLQQVLAERLTC
jgi:hypothetical protein